MKRFLFFLIIFSVLRPVDAQPLLQDLLYHPWVDSVYNSLSNEERIAQLVWINVWADDTDNTKREWQDKVEQMIRKYNLGGIIFFVGQAERQAELTNRYQSAAKTPLMVVMDAEWGPAMRLPGVIPLPYNMTMGAADPALVQEAATCMARQLKRLGVHMSFGPVVDVNTQSLNPVIGMRSFGESPAAVAARGLAYMRGLQENRILAVAKHFPGHGDTRSDSHFTLPVVPWGQERLDAVELLPFRELVNAGIGGVMTAHLHVPALDPTQGVPSSLSPAIIQKLLREKWNYGGLIVTDAMNMAGVGFSEKPGEIDVLALKAGNDVIEYPKDAEITIEAIKQAVKEGKLSQEEINIKCRRVLAAKFWAGLNRKQHVEQANLMAELNAPAVEMTKRKVIESALTLLENKGQLLPLQNLEKLKVASLSVGTDIPTPFQKMLSNYMPVKHFNLPADFSEEVLKQLKMQLKDYNLVIVGLHLFENKTRLSMQVGNMQIATPSRPYGLTDNIEKLLQYLGTEKKSVEVFFGSPYALSEVKNFKKPDALIIAYQNDPLVQELAAQMIFGGIGAKGKLPVSLGNYYRIGDGLSIGNAIRLKYTIPEEVGIRSDRLNQKLDSVAALALREKAIPGYQLLVAKDGKIIFHKAYGYKTFDNNFPVTEDDLYDLASVTKVCSGLPAMLRFYDEGKVKLDNPVADYYKDWRKRSSGKSDITIRELYAHQSGLVPFIGLWRQTVNEEGALLAKWYSRKPDKKHSLAVAPNIYLNNKFEKVVHQEISKSPLKTRGQYVYSDLPLVITPQIVKNISKRDFVQLLEEEFFRPLGAYELTFNPLNKFPIEQIVPTEVDDYYRRQLVWGTVHDESAAVMGGVSGNAGLFASANDLAKLMQLFLQMGTYGGKRYFSREAMEEFNKVQFPEVNRRGLFWDKPLLDNAGRSLADAYPCPGASPESFGHSGFTGTWVWMDPQCGLTYIFLGNRVYPTRDNKKFGPLNIRTNSLQIVYDEIANIGKISVTEPDKDVITLKVEPGKDFSFATPILQTDQNDFNVPIIRTSIVYQSSPLKTGAEQTDVYLPWLKDKRVAIVGNNTSVIGRISLVDSLLALGVNIKKVFGPEHGFRGNASAGAHVGDNVDPITKIPEISLYGQKTKPSKEDLSDVDIVIFDIQDVGARFYTYINLLGRVMEACAENDKELLILDRPNPNGFSVDGPILDSRLKSGIGAWPIPITHGMTIGELAQMYNGEGWLEKKVKCKIRIVPVANYNHSMLYTLPVAPSPNLNTQQSILLYPSTCLFEGTIMSEGRGTYNAFSLIGAPKLKGKYDFSFTPVSISGMAETPLHQNEECFGLDLRNYDISDYIHTGKINLQWLIELYNAYPEKAKFFDATQSRQINDFNRLAGVYELKQQIIADKSEAEIRASWEPGLSNFKKIRAKYLLYP